MQNQEDIVNPLNTDGGLQEVAVQDVSSGTLNWTNDTVKAPAVRELLSVLGAEYPVVQGVAGSGCVELEVVLDAGSPLVVSADSGRATVTAAEPSQIARGVGILLSRLCVDGEIVERTGFKTRGVMLDCSRSAVMKPSYVKQYITRLSLLGYNMVMLYTKDTYKLPGEEYFGYLRGAYSMDEIREIDAHASRLGVEVVACIQALGHLEPVLRWPAYADVRDTVSVLHTGAERTYELISKMLDFWSQALGSRRIHLGMDESYGLGRGRFMDANGYRPPTELFRNHLAKVRELCRLRKLRPIIWSDMCFRLSNSEMDYYAEPSASGSQVLEQIPEDVQLAYWDYYHQDEAFYIRRLKAHQAISSGTMMASGIWTWPQLWYNHRKTADTVAPCISACGKQGVEEILFTMWGDDGACCDWSSAWAGACYCAERLFNGNNEPGAALMESRFAAVCRGNYGDHLLASEMSVVNDDAGLQASAVLWDDPLLGIYWKERQAADGDFWPRALQRYRRISLGLEGRPAGSAGDLTHAALIAGLLGKKIELSCELHQAYRRRSPRLIESVMRMIPDIIDMYEELHLSFRRQWHDRCKTFGFEVIQGRLASLAARYRELRMRLGELLAGRINEIAELDETISTPKGPPSTHFESLSSAYVNSVTTL
ncbi:MAG: beta-N-acetylhexosaminidase [Planctomycetes bacterium]|nr:beta-N-acetylhexosaminidase [Planctomycetota bacterium]